MSDQQGWVQPGAAEPPDQQHPHPDAPQPYPEQPHPEQSHPEPRPHPGSLYGPPAGWAPVLRPGIVPLRPLSLGEIYDGAFQALRTNPRTMLGATAIVVTVMALVDLLISLLMARSVSGLLALDQQDEITEENVGEVLGALGAVSTGALLSAVTTTFGVAVITGVLTLAVSQAVLGRTVPLGELWQQTRGRLLPLIGLTLLVGLTITAAFLGAVLPGLVVLVVEPLAGGVLLVAGVLGGIALALWLYAKLALATPALMLENEGVTGAWKRSWHLTRGSFWRVLGILLLTVVLTTIAIAVVAGPFQVVALLLGSGSDDVLAQTGLSPPQLVLQAVGQVLSSTVVYPFSAAVTALLYVDLRMRREGLDVQLAQRAEQSSP